MKILRLLVAVQMLIGLAMPALSQQNDRDNLVYVQGIVKDKLTGIDLPKANVIVYDSTGLSIDTIPARRKVNLDGDTRAIFYIRTDRRLGTLTFDVECDGYNTATIVRNLSQLPKKENTLSLGTVLLERAPRKLDEITVRASKVKFYNKGDTIVYNADAFMLAEGSMLDALIEQLPGVELKQNGEISVNGEYVEELLVNGRDFFKGNNNVTLENIGAYTVKNIEVYRGQTLEEKWLNDSTLEKHLTMNVKLKKEYNSGYMGNLQGGAGTEGRYIGRVFASYFSPTFILGLTANVNNVNDSRKPGRNDTWSPQSMSSGVVRRNNFGVTYDYLNVNETLKIDGNTIYEEERPDTRLASYRTNFLTGGDTYEYYFSNSRTRNLKFNTRNYVRSFLKDWMFFGMGVANWARRNSLGTGTSATFRSEQDSITKAVIEAIYSDGSPERLDAVINRSLSHSDGVRTSAEGQAFFGVSRKLPRDANIYNETGVKYRTDHNRTWNEYLINYGADPVPASHRRNYTDVQPDHVLTVINDLTGTFSLGNVRVSLNWEYRFIDNRRNSSMYALERLADMGVYGVLPAGWTDAFDPSNSYTSRTLEVKNSLTPRIRYSHEYKKWRFDIDVDAEFGIHHRRLDYNRDGRDYRLSRTARVINSKGGSKIRVYQERQDNGGSLQNSSLNAYEYKLTVSTALPNLMNMVDVTDDSNPLYITVGNPDLRTAYTWDHQLSWTWKPMGKSTRNTLTFKYSYTTDAQVRGYTYDTSTGVRVTRSYNVDDNNTLSGLNHFFKQFGSSGQFAVDSRTNVSFSHSADMVGMNMDAPVRSTVRNRIITQTLNFNWNIGKQNLGLTGEVTDRRATSTRADFRAIDANHYKYGLVGTFRLPYNIGVSTNFTVYTRRGYGLSEIDTTDKIWDMRVSYAFGKGKWVVMADAFDLLHQLSNVSYSVSATGRSVVYTNTIPRYMMLSVQYRFNHNPKKLATSHFLIK